MIRFIGTMFGSGNSPIMPGTCGSLVALLIAFLIPGEYYSSSIGVLALFATLTGPPLARRFMAKTGGKDPQDFVYDEAAGLWIAIWRPFPASPYTLILGFLLFRLFDMWKPGPIRRVEKWTNGYGVVYDDVLAGILALVLSWAVESFLI